MTPREYLSKLSNTPHMWAVTKEAFLARVDTCLRLAGIPSERVQLIYSSVLVGNDCNQVYGTFEDTWAREVVRYALGVLDAVETGSKEPHG